MTCKLVANTFSKDDYKNALKYVLNTGVSVISIIFKNS